MADTDTARTQKANCEKEGLRDTERFFRNELFIAGLKDEFRSKIIEAGKATLKESLSLAGELEVIIQDKKKATLSAFTKEEDTLGEEDIWDNLEPASKAKATKNPPALGMGILVNTSQTRSADSAEETIYKRFAE